MIEEVSFTRALLTTFAVAFGMFGIAGGLLYAFWRTFEDEERGADRRRRLILFTVLVAALVIFAGLVLWWSYQL